MKKIIAILMVVFLMATCGACVNKADVRGTLSDDTSVATEQPAETVEETEEVDLSLGKAEGTVYKSDFIGIGFNLDEEWSFYDDDKIKELNNMATDMAGEEFQEAIKDATIVYDMYAADADGINNVNINLEKVNRIQLAALDIADNYEKVAPMMEEGFNNMGYTNYSYEIKEIVVDGKTVDAMCNKAEINGVTMYQVMFQKKCSGYLASMCVTSFIEDTTAGLLDNFFWLD